jgi:methylase of polypeptide subunit release factors
MYLKRGYIFVLEIPFNKAQSVAQIFQEAGLNVEIEIIQDLNKKDRVLIAKDRN